MCRFVHRNWEFWWQMKGGHWCIWIAYIVAPSQFFSPPEMDSEFSFNCEAHHLTDASFFERQPHPKFFGQSNQILWELPNVWKVVTSLRPRSFCFCNGWMISTQLWVTGNAKKSGVFKGSFWGSGNPIEVINAFCCQTKTWNKGFPNNTIPAFFECHVVKLRPSLQTCRFSAFQILITWVVGLRAPRVERIFISQGAQQFLVFVGFWNCEISQQYHDERPV